jgi:acetyl-CoA carboxylase carboxyl transferase subunit alpha
MTPEPLEFEADIHELETRLAALDASAGSDAVAAEVKALRQQVRQLLKATYDTLTPWQTVQVSRHPKRPQFLDYVDLITDDFLELHGDRSFGDDRAIRTGFARIGEYKVMLVGHHKGRTLAERQQCFYGCAHPEGYRKAMAKMILAAKYRVPVICLIDTPGAYPGIGAEERGQSQLIATSIFEMTRLPTQIICVVIGEGGSGGALGIGVGDRVAMLRHSYYSVISPEGCAGILWKTATAETKPKAAACLGLTSDILKSHNVVDDVIPEPLGGAHRSPKDAGTNLKNYILSSLRSLEGTPTDELLAGRYDKFRRLGSYLED